MTTGWMSYGEVSRPALFSCDCLSTVRLGDALLVEYGLDLTILQLPGLSYNQLNNNLTSQAATMSTHGLPNDVLSNLDPFALVIFIPLCDLIVCTYLLRVRGIISQHLCVHSSIQLLLNAESPSALCGRFPGASTPVLQR